jgi:hypothetical protein
MDDFHNALNSIQLGAGFSTIQKVDHNGFSVSTKTKTFHFRVPNPNNARPHSAVIAERDKWFETLTAAVMPSKQRPVSIGQEIELDSESQDPSIMFKMLSRELKSLSQSLSHIEGSTFAVAQVRKLQQMTKAIQHRTSLRNTTTKPPNTPPVMLLSPPVEESMKDSLLTSLKTMRSKFKRIGSNKTSGGSRVSKISSPMLLINPNDPTQPTVVSAKAAAVPCPLVSYSSVSEDKKEEDPMANEQNKHPVVKMPVPPIPPPYVPKQKRSSIGSASIGVESKPAYYTVTQPVTANQQDDSEYTEIVTQSSLPAVTQHQGNAIKSNEDTVAFKFHDTELGVAEAYGTSPSDTSPNASSAHSPIIPTYEYVESSSCPAPPQPPSPNIPPSPPVSESPSAPPPPPGSPGAPPLPPPPPPPPSLQTIGYPPSEYTPTSTPISTPIHSFYPYTTQ